MADAPPPSGFFQHIPGSPQDNATVTDLNNAIAGQDAKYGGVDGIAFSPPYSAHIVGDFGGLTYNTVRIPGVSEILEWREWVVLHYVEGNGAGYAMVAGSFYTSGPDPADTLKVNMVPLASGLVHIDVFLYLYIVGRP